MNPFTIGPPNTWELVIWVIMCRYMGVQILRERLQLPGAAWSWNTNVWHFFLVIQLHQQLISHGDCLVFLSATTPDYSINGDSLIISANASFQFSMILICSSEAWILIIGWCWIISFFTSFQFLRIFCQSSKTRILVIGWWCFILHNSPVSDDFDLLFRSMDLDHWWCWWFHSSQVSSFWWFWFALSKHEPLIIGWWLFICVIRCEENGVYGLVVTTPQSLHCFLSFDSSVFAKLLWTQVFASI